MHVFGAKLVQLYSLILIVNEHGIVRPHRSLFKQLIAQFMLHTRHKPSTVP